jgi:hypothetical protein
MRILLFLGWLAIPALVCAYHYGPGQDRMKLDDADARLVEARGLAKAGDYAAAADAYDEALGLLPADRKAVALRVRLERDKAQMLARELPEASQDLKGLVDELESDPKADPRLLADAREAMANSQYYLTWLMRLEGMAREAWEPEIESARQIYRLLADQAEEAGEAGLSKKHAEDLEGAIRLARMEPDDLQGLAIPKQCQGCKSGQCKKKGRTMKAKTGPKDGRGASSGPPPDGSGS